jgi:esterase/lipase
MLLHSRIEGSGKPLFIIHGFLGMSDNWKSLGSNYAAEGFEVHMLDLEIMAKVFIPMSLIIP